VDAGSWSAPDRAGNESAKPDTQDYRFRQSRRRAECRIVAKKLESFVRQRRSRIGARAGKKIIDANHIRSVREQPPAEMGAKEPGATSN
jgi:hypothetical protein